MGKIDTLNSYIEECDRLQQRTVPEKEKSDFVKKVVGVYIDEIPRIRYELDRYRQRIWTEHSPPTVYDNDGDLEKLKGKLINYRENLEMQAQNQAQPSQTSVVNVTQNNTSESIANSGSKEQTFIDSPHIKAGGNIIAGDIKVGNNMILSRSERIQELEKDRAMHQKVLDEEGRSKFYFVFLSAAFAVIAFALGWFLGTLLGVVDAASFNIAAVAGALVSIFGLIYQLETAKRQQEKLKDIDMSLQELKNRPD